MAKIALFDSGYGGLTIFGEVRKLLPDYDYLYLGDNARAPYGSRSFDVVYAFTLQAVERLFSLGADLIILACNTASAKALRSIQINDLPRLDPSGTKRVLGVIRPSVEALGLMTQAGHVGIMGTQGTVSSLSFVIEMQKLWPNVLVCQQACPMWVPLVENGEFDKPGADYFVSAYTNQLMSKDPQIDAIMLACTHFPLLAPKIAQILPPNVKLLSQGEIVARSLKDYLARHPNLESRLSRHGSASFFTTESPEKFADTAGLFFEGNLAVQHIEMGT